MASGGAAMKTDAAKEDPKASCLKEIPAALGLEITAFYANAFHM